MTEGLGQVDGQVDGDPAAQFRRKVGDGGAQGVAEVEGGRWLVPGPDSAAEESSRSTSRASSFARWPMIRAAWRRSASVSDSQWSVRVSAYPLITVTGVRSSWLVTATKRSCSWSRRCWSVMSRKVTTRREPGPGSSPEVIRSQRPSGSRWSSTCPGGGWGTAAAG